MQESLEGPVWIACEQANFNQFLEPAIMLDTLQS
jgi:hypothetical protein